MASKADEVYRAGLELGTDERTVVAHRLLASLHHDDDSSCAEVDADWRVEIASRVDQVLDGTAELSTFDQARARARSLLEELGE